jgi:hypothetical protein
VTVAVAVAVAPEAPLAIKV